MRFRSLLSVAVLAVSLAGCGGGAASPRSSETVQPQPAAGAVEMGGVEIGAVEIGPFAMVVPASWKPVAPTSEMRAAQFQIGASELVVYHFGVDGAGSVQANLDRWFAQFEQADGSASADAAKTEKIEVNGLAVTLADVSGRYIAAVRPGATEKHDKPDHRMLAAIVETSSGPYYMKLLGPAAEVAALTGDWEKAIASIATR